MRKIIKIMMAIMLVLSSMHVSIKVNANNVVVEGIDTSTLEELLRNAKELSLDLYSENSQEALREAILRSETLLQKENKTQTEIDSQYQSLKFVLDHLTYGVLSDEFLINKKANDGVSVVDKTSEYIKDGQSADKTLDYNNQTFWHSNWEGNDVLPQSITYDLGKEYTLTDITFLPRQDASWNGDILEMNLYIGNDVNDLILIGTYTFEAGESGLLNRTQMKRIHFEGIGQYVKVEVIKSDADTEVGKNQWATIAEIRFYGSECIEQPIVVNKDGLNEIIADVEILNENDYTIQSWEVLMNTFNDAKEVVKADCTQEDVDTMIVNLQFAINQLIEKSEEVETIVPEVVSNVKVVQDSYKSVTITWDVVENATAYDVYRKTYKADALFSKVATVTEPIYIASGLMTGKEYSFYVIAKNEVSESENSEIATIATQLEGKPTLSIEKVSKTKFTLSWSEVDGATRYIIYRKRENDPWKKVLTLGGDDLTYTTGELPKGEYSFIVKAGRYDSTDRVMTQSSNAATGTSIYSKPVITLTPESKQIKVSWKKIEGVKYYQVYRATSKEGKYTLLKTTTTTSFTAKSLTSGKRYYFKVKGYKSYNNGEKTYKVYTLYSTIQNAISK